VGTEVVHDADHARYVLRVDGEVVGVADYRDRGDALVFHHTEIDRARRGHHLGATLVRGALDDIRVRSRVVVPTCWFVADFVERHPAYRDLLAPPASH
jgi:predicted GNAT family acetyltransferase